MFCAGYDLLPPNKHLSSVELRNCRVVKQHLGVLIRPHFVTIDVSINCTAKEPVHIDEEKDYVIFHNRKITFFDVSHGKMDFGAVLVAEYRIGPQGAVAVSKKFGFASFRQ